MSEKRSVTVESILQFQLEVLRQQEASERWSRLFGTKRPPKVVVMGNSTGPKHGKPAGGEGVMKCDKCGINVRKTPLYRVGPPGVPAQVWLCSSCHPDHPYDADEAQAIIDEAVKHIQALIPATGQEWVDAVLAARDFLAKHGRGKEGA